MPLVRISLCSVSGIVGRSPVVSVESFWIGLATVAAVSVAVTAPPARTWSISSPALNVPAIDPQGLTRPFFPVANDAEIVIAPPIPLANRSHFDPFCTPYASPPQIRHFSPRWPLRYQSRDVVVIGNIHLGSGASKSPDMIDARRFLNSAAKMPSCSIHGLLTTRVRTPENQST